MTEIKGKIVTADYSYDYDSEGRRSIVSHIGQNFYVMPDHASLYLEPAHGLAAKIEGVRFWLRQDPPTSLYFGSDEGADKVAETNAFPPVGPFFIHEDGRTSPANLADLVKGMERNGWTVSEEAAKELKLRTPQDSK